ncbi:MAG: glycoside hydrolase family 95 protein [Proteobacteria bacterium]|nr:glycoside hydrolase family 95 protein [Pseudomonadota bacterium]
MVLSRRDLLKATAALAAAGAGGIAFAGDGDATRMDASASVDGVAIDDASSSPLRLWYRQPATQWVEALPVGNGRLGAMVWGDAVHERIQLNEATLYAGGPYTAVNPQSRATLAKVRELIFAGHYADAERLADDTLISRPVKQMPYQPLADLLIDHDRVDNTRDYQRELDLDGAVANTVFGTGDARIRRTVFASAPDGCIVVHVACARPGGISLRIGIDSPQSGRVEAVDGHGLLFSGRNADANGIGGALRFALRVHVQTEGGSVHVERDRLVVRDADAVILRIVSGTSHRAFDDVGGDPLRDTATRLAAVCAIPLARLLQRHQSDHRALFRRVALDLGHTAAAQGPTDERVREYAKGDDPSLAALYHQYGRYLLIASSRAGGQPANLQGIWNDRMAPPWESKYTLNINTEMNYWPAEAGALGECVAPLEMMVRELAVTGADVAHRMYGAPGWVTHNNTDLWRVATPPDGAQWALWPMGGAWLLQQLWDRWDYGRDRAYLASVWPLFKGAAEFFMATLLRDPRTGAMVTNPSVSPENRHPFGAAVCAGPSMDAQLLRDLFDHCIHATRILGVDGDFAGKLAALREQLPPHRIGKAGQLQEWQQDWDMQAPEPHHRHVSHLYALHPSSQINLRDTPELAAAARRSLELRGDDATGWGIAWRLNLWARLGDGEHAYKVLAMLLTPQRTYPNLFDAHPPFQIDGNFGGTSGITEMLMQSWGGTVFLLPALPKAWPTGEVRGLRVRNAASIDLAWREGRLAKATLHSDKGGDYALAYRNDTMELRLKANEAVDVVLHGDRLVRA